MGYLSSLDLAKKWVREMFPQEIRRLPVECGPIEDPVLLTCRQSNKLQLVHDRVEFLGIVGKLKF
jgi:hypothetical protein